MLMSHSGVTTMILCVSMMVLLSVMRLMRLLLVLVRQIHLHKSLVTSCAVHHGMLPLLMTLVIHAERIVGGILRDRGTRRGRSFVMVATSSVVDR